MLVTLLPIITHVKPLQKVNAKSPILVTLLGIVILVKPLQQEKALLPMLVTLLGIVILVKPLQPEKAQEPMLVTLLGITEFLQPVINLFVDFSIIALQLSRESYTVFPDSTTIDVKPLQSEKA